jgi:succinate dehydrogenase/fumarate reductase flavoprotein subunit
MTDLVVTDGQISGAAGVETRTGDIYSFRAKAVVLSSGRSNRLGRNLTGVDFNTRIPSPMSGDGISMAIRAGLRIVNIEFLSGRALAPCGNYNPNYGDPRNTVQPAARIIDEQGDVLIPRTQFYDWENLGKEKWTVEIRKRWLEERRSLQETRRLMAKKHNEGGGPFFLDFSEATDKEAEYIEWSIKNEGRGTQFMRYFRDEEGADLRRNMQEYAGYWPRELSGNAAMGFWVDKDLEADVRGLFGAGDAVAGLPWSAAPGAFALGWRAGEMASERARGQREFLPVKDEILQVRKAICSDMLNRARGFYWKEVETYVQNLMDFYCGDIRSEALLKRGLERLEDAKAAPLKAENPHELGRSLDVKSIIDNAEPVLRSSIERKESRPVPNGFRRAEYPEQDDKNWLCFLAIRNEKGAFKFSKIPIE